MLVILRSTGRGSYSASKADGTTLVRSSKSPEYATCRALVGAGYSGPVEFARHVDGKIGSRIASAVAGAKLTIEETDARGLQTRPWREFALRR